MAFSSNWWNRNVIWVCISKCNKVLPWRTIASYRIYLAYNHTRWLRLLKELLWLQFVQVLFKNKQDVVPSTRRIRGTTILIIVMYRVYYFYSAKIWLNIILLYVCDHHLTSPTRRVRPNIPENSQQWLAQNSRQPAQMAEAQNKL